MKHNGRKSPIGVTIGGQAIDSENNKVLEQTKKPAELDSVAPDINGAYKDQQETGILPPPSTTQILTNNPNPKTESRNILANKFNEIPHFSSDNKLTGDYQLETVSTKDFTSTLKKLGMKFDLNIESGTLLSRQYSKATIMDFYSQLFNPESGQKISDKTYPKIEYNSELFLEMVNLLESTLYNGLKIIVDENINPNVLQMLKTKYNNGEAFVNLEPLIADVGCYLMGGFRYDGMVNSESDFNENSFEKAEENLEKLGVMKQSGSSMPELEPGGKVGYIKHESGKEYEIGDIIIYNKKGVIIFHEVVSYKDTRSGRVYTTKGINNKNPDRKGVYEHQILGQVVKFSKQDLAYLTEMAEQGRLSYIEGFGMTKFNEIIQKIVSVFKGLKSKLSQALFDKNDELDSLMANTELNYEDVSNFIDKIAELKPDDVGKPLNFLRNLKRQSINEYYEILNEYASKELKVIIKPGVTNAYKALDLIMNAHILFNFKEYDGYKGIVIENVKVDPDNIAYTQFKAKSYPSGRIIINENFYLNRDLMDMVLNNFIPHELGHIEIRQEYDGTCEGLGIDCLKWGIVDNQIAEEIEEFIVDANTLSNLDGERKIRYAEQYCKWLDLLLSEKWSGFTDVNGEQKSAEDLTSREMLIIMHHKVILEYIQQNVLRNNRDLDVIKQRINDYYEGIINFLIGKQSNNYDYNIGGNNFKNFIETYIIDKFESYLDSYVNLEEFLEDFKDTEVIHEGESWIEYISHILVPSFNPNPKQST